MFNQTWVPKQTKWLRLKRLRQILTILQKAWTKEEVFSNGVLTMGKEPIRSSNEVSASEYCRKKLQSFTESGLIRLVGLIDNSVSFALGDEGLQKDVSSRRLRRADGGVENPMY